MKKEINIPNLVLYILICLVVILLLVTLIVFKTKNPSLNTNLRRIDPTPEQIQQSNKKSDNAIYTALGTLRTTTSDLPPITIVIAPYFPYDATKQEFYEEIAQKTRKIKQLFISYFLDKTKEELLIKGEQGIKAEILSQINEEFVLGKISELYFSQYIFFE